MSRPGQSQDLAWAWATALYTRRVTELDFPSLVPLLAYAGPIPVTQIVEAAPLPASSSLEHHRAAWGAMRQIFDDEVHQLERELGAA